jgi:probable addiction module antidote protein
MTEKFTRWDPVDYLHTESDQALYLNACLEEDPGDGSLIRIALGDIARARGMSQLARETGISREGLYHALSADGNPEFATVLKVIRALGIQLSAQPLSGKTAHHEDPFPATPAHA